uniref:Uncharacterized protein n=1 Tax=Setaria viridis TaxID=4556 RepID=A0A4V6D1E0_SETVI|nr:hypothetical protein SEVIR_9G287600v2 [Setaria viridis]
MRRLHLHHLHLTLFQNHLSRFFNRCPKTPIEFPSSSTTSASPDAPAVDASNNDIDESHIVFDELQAGPRFNLREAVLGWGGVRSSGVGEWRRARAGKNRNR